MLNFKLINYFFIKLYKHYLRGGASPGLLKGNFSVFSFIWDRVNFFSEKKLCSPGINKKNPGKKTNM